MMKTNCENHQDDDGSCLNPLHSELSALLHQIDELVVKSLKVKKSVSKEGRREIESFSSLLSEMLSRLAPWVPRLQTVLSSTSVEPEGKTETVPCDESNECDCDSLQETTMDSLVSPSPLVSWRANCAVERGRQMFMLTPLPLSKAMLSSKPHQPKSEFTELTSTTNSVLYSVAMNPTPVKPALSIVSEEATNEEDPESSILPKRDTSMIVMMTPSLKMSPPKSCVLLEPISEICHVGNDKFRKSTPFPFGVHYSDSEDSESSGSDYASQGLALKFPELLGIQRVSKSGFEKKTVEASPVWLASPPKTCVLLGTPDEKSLVLEKVDNDPSIQINESILKQREIKLKDDVSKDHNQVRKSCNQDHLAGNLSHVESNPMWMEPESSLQTGKRPGENTLKKELWTRFEAASTCGFQPEFPTVCKNSHKGFLDLLEEASCDE